MAAIFCPVFSSASCRVKGCRRRRVCIDVSVSYPHRQPDRDFAQKQHLLLLNDFSYFSPKSHLPAPHLRPWCRPCSMSARPDLPLAALRHLSNHPCFIRPVLGDDEHVAEARRILQPLSGLPDSGCPVEKGLDARPRLFSLKQRRLNASLHGFLTLCSAPSFRRPRFIRKALQKESLRAWNACHAYNPFSATPAFVLCPAPRCCHHAWRPSVVRSHSGRANTSNMSWIIGYDSLEGRLRVRSPCRIEICHSLIDTPASVHLEQITTLTCHGMCDIRTRHNRSANGEPPTPLATALVARAI